MSAYDVLLMSSLVQAKWMSCPSASAREVPSAPPPALGVRPGQQVDEPTAQEVLDGLHVVHRLGLDDLQLTDRVGVEVDHQCPQGLLLLRREAGGAGHHVVLDEVQQPLHLDVQPRPVQRRLGEVVDERRDRAAVPPVQGTQGDAGGEFGERRAGGGQRHTGIVAGSGDGPGIVGVNFRLTGFGVKTMLTS